MIPEYFLPVYIKCPGCAEVERLTANKSWLQLFWMGFPTCACEVHGHLGYWPQWVSVDSLLGELRTRGDAPVQSTNEGI